MTNKISPIDGIQSILLVSTTLRYLYCDIFTQCQNWRYVILDDYCKLKYLPFRPAEFPTLKLGLCGIEFSNVNTLLYLFLYFFVSAKLAKWLLRRLFFEFLYYYEYLFKWQDNHYLDNFKLLLFHLNDMIVYLHSIVAVILFCFTLFILASN